MLARLFRPRPAKARAEAVYLSLTRQARRPELYGALGAPDTNEGRFEIYALHLAVVLRRLKRQGGEAEELSQALFDRFVRGLDDAMREMGVGDLSVGKKMRKLGEQLYGRLKRYDEALDAEDETLLDPLLERTVFAGVDSPDPQPLAAYARSADSAFASAPLEVLFAGDLPWPPIRS